MEESDRGREDPTDRRMKLVRASVAARRAPPDNETTPLRLID